MKAGVYQGGVRDVKSLKARCVVDAETGCWRFHTLRMWVRMPGGGYKTLNRRRAGIVVCSGADLPSGVLAFRAVHCPHADCVRPDHTQLGNRHEFMQAMSAVGALHTAARHETWLKCCSARRKLRDEQIAVIATSRRKAKDLAAEHGCSISRVNQIRSQAGVGRRRVPNSVFTYRPASACSLSK